MSTTEEKDNQKTPGRGMKQDASKLQGDKRDMREKSKDDARGDSQRGSQGGSKGGSQGGSKRGNR